MSATWRRRWAGASSHACKAHALTVWRHETNRDNWSASTRASICPQMAVHQRYARVRRRSSNSRSVSGLSDCQFHSLTIEVRDNARYLRACVWRGILEPKNSEILKADGREHRRQVRGEKRERASLLVHGARIAVNDEASEPNAPSLCRYRGEFNPKIRKFEQVRRSGLDSILVMTANKSLPGQALLHREPFNSWRPLYSGGQRC